MMMVKILLASGAVSTKKRGDNIKLAAHNATAALYTCGGECVLIHYM